MSAIMSAIMHDATFIHVHVESIYYNVLQWIGAVREQVTHISTFTNIFCSQFQCLKLIASKTYKMSFVNHLDNGRVYNIIFLTITILSVPNLGQPKLTDLNP